MTTPQQPDFRQQRAFTLIELLVVIAIIGILAGLLIPLGAAVKRKAQIAQTQAQLNQMVTWIEGYKEKRGHYPQDNTNNPALSPLFYELLGTELRQGIYRTLQVNQTIAQNVAQSAFNIGGFVNASLPGSGDDFAGAKSFAQNLSPKNYGEVTSPRVAILVSASAGPAMIPGTPKPLNPWNYVSTAPTNNPGSFDLWVDLRIGGKNYRIANWSKAPIPF